MKCLACQMELEQGVAKCGACGFPVIGSVAGSEEEQRNIKQMAGEYRKNRLKGIRIGIMAYGYAMDGDELKLDRTRFRNDTGEITLDAEQGTFLVQTEKSEAFLLKEDNRLHGKFASVENRRSFCALLLSAMDGKSLKESGRFLILHLTQTVNRGMTFRTQDCSVLETWSEKPLALLFRRGEADLIVNRDLSGFQLYALNLAGKRLGKVPFRTRNGKSVLSLKTDWNGEVVAAYELVGKKAD